MIQSTTFGAITIDGRTYTSDLFIFPDGRVQDGWWRRRGHVLAVDDLISLVDAAPQVIVAGTGVSGRMRPEAEVFDFLNQRGIQFIAEVNASALKSYNQMCETERKVGACFHLTC